MAEADQERFDRLRYVETKHGRISMLAILGHLVTTAGKSFMYHITYFLYVVLSFTIQINV